MTPTPSLDPQMSRVLDSPPSRTTHHHRWHIQARSSQLLIAPNGVPSGVDACTGRLSVCKPKIAHNNPRRLYIPLCCNQSTQTQPESDYGGDSTDFPPVKVGKRMSPGSAIRRNPPSNKDPPQPHHPRQPNAGLGRTNVINAVNATTPRNKLLSFQTRGASKLLCFELERAQT